MNEQKWDRLRTKTSECQRGGGVGLGQKGEGVEKERRVVTKQSQGCKQSIGNILSNIGIVMNGGSWGIGTTEAMLDKVHDCLTTKLSTETSTK